MGAPKAKPDTGILKATHSVLQMKLSGYDYDAIAEALGLPRASIERLVLDAVAKVATEVDALAIYEYALSAERWDKLWRANERLLASHDPDALASGVSNGSKLLERRAKLTGSDRAAAPSAPVVGGYTINVTEIVRP